MLAGLESLQDGYDNERGDQGDRAESDDELSDEEAVPFKCINAADENHYQHHLKKAYLTLHEQDKPCSECKNTARAIESKGPKCHSN